MIDPKRTARTLAAAVTLSTAVIGGLPLHAAEDTSQPPSEQGDARAPGDGRATGAERESGGKRETVEAAETGAESGEDASGEASQSPEVFRPSEEISEDLSVAFPEDI